jgi:serine/threonine protein kinase/predicted negative regulator of RcsB-dependent stress response
MKGPSTNDPDRRGDEVIMTDVVFFEEGAPPSDSAVDPLLREMGEAWRNGGRPAVEHFLERRPELANNTDAVLRLICEEICLREETGAEVDSGDFLRRFPRWRDEVQSLLDCRHIMQSKASPAGLDHAPTLADFNLLAELGEGAQGQVFLATQPALADRPVVLKITRCHGDEHRALARLQHTHIVPLYWAQDDEEQDRRILCMPYFGNVTLGDLFKSLKDKPPARRSGQDILDVLEKGRESAAIPLPGAGPARQYLSRAAYVDAVCWMGACLSDALHYAHERGLLHLDIKPTNVLLAADGQPMLLDFHLARGPIRPDSPPPRGMGGTPYFMSPEQQLAMEAVCGGRPVTAVVDGRSDIYSLALVLYQALSGQVPLQSPPPRLDVVNPRVSPGLADVIQKCLARDPRNRYADAAALASDLRRHLGHLPLKGVANRSWPERWRKWRRRKPHALSVSVLLVTLLVTCAAAALYILDRTRQSLLMAETDLDSASKHIEAGQFDQAIERLQQGEATAAATPGGGEFEPRFAQLLRVAKHGRAVETLHGLVDQLRLLPGSEDHSPEALRKLEANCRTLWESRGKLLDELETVSPTEGKRRQLYTDLLDLALIWSDLRVRLAGDAEGRKLASQQALAILEEAEGLRGPSAVLLFEREAHARNLGRDDLEKKAERERLDRKMAPRTAWEFYALGRSLLQKNRHEDAMPYLDEAVYHEPKGFWPNFYQGVCAYRLGKYSDAVAAFRSCLSVPPNLSNEQLARCYYNRALAEVNLDLVDRALKDYTESLNRYPSLGVAALNRGILYYGRKQYPEAEDDLREALKHVSDPRLRVACHYNLARVCLDRGNRPEALNQVELALETDSQHGESLRLLRLLKSKMGR